MEEEKQENAAERENIDNMPVEETPPEQEKAQEQEVKEEEQVREEVKEEEQPVVEEPKVEEVKEEQAPVVEEAPKVEEPKAPEAEKEEEKPAEEEAEAKAEKPKTLGEKKWYVIQALTGQEDKVKQAIDLTIKMNKGLQDKVFQVLVPTEEIVEIKGGKRIEKVKNMFPGYVFLEMILDEESWYLMRETPGVARFIGTKVKPTPVSEREMQRVLKQLGKEEKLLEITFEKGEGVRIISGPFRGYTGTVDEVNAEKGKLKILVNIFGRDTPVEVNFEHAQKIV